MAGRAYFEPSDEARAQLKGKAFFFSGALEVPASPPPAASPPPSSPEMGFELIDAAADSGNPPCPEGWIQYPACADALGCGLNPNCGQINRAESIDDCARQCLDNPECHTIEWSSSWTQGGAKGDACNLNAETGPTTRWCGPFVFCGLPLPPPPPPPPLPPPNPSPAKCPDDFVQYPACSDVMGCGYTGCSPWNTATSIEDCAAQCREDPRCHTLEWLGDGQYAGMCNFNEEWVPTTTWCYEGTFLFCGKPVPPPSPPPPTPMPPPPPPSVPPIDGFCHYDLNATEAKNYRGEYGKRDGCPAYLSMTFYCCTPFRTHKPAIANFPYASDGFEEVCMEYFTNRSDCGGAANAYNVMDMCCDYEWRCGPSKKGWCGQSNWRHNPSENAYHPHPLREHVERKQPSHVQPARSLGGARGDGAGAPSGPDRRTAGLAPHPGTSESRQHGLEPPSIGKVSVPV